jgi:hypothetical protein
MLSSPCIRCLNPLLLCGVVHGIDGMCCVVYEGCSQWWVMMLMCRLVLNGVGLKKRVGEYKHDHTATININT